jgi:hypothetical protein
MDIGDERVVLLEKEARAARNFATIDDEHVIFQANLVNYPPVRRSSMLFATSSQMAAKSRRSCPLAWCSWRRVGAIAGMGQRGQPAIAGRLRAGSSLKGAMVSRLI